MKQLTLLLGALLIGGAALAQNTNKQTPPRYVCYQASQPVVIDGDIYGEEWAAAPWSDAFVDIRGEEHPVKPIYVTRMKMLWDSENLYIAGELPEKHIWATITERDEVIYWDNDFEVFLDPDGDTHNYFEYETNAFATEWDLLMTKGYRFGGTFINGFTIKGLETKTKIYGTINDPSDEDEKWTVEIKIPLRSLVNHDVKSGEQWRMNFSRVEWLKVSVVDGKYKKNPGTEGFGNEENWVWAPTGVVDIHRPEHWGFVQFSDKQQGNPKKDFVWNEDETIKRELREVLDFELDHFNKHGKFSDGASSTRAGGFSYFPAHESIIITKQNAAGDTWYISSDSRTWCKRAK